MIPVAPAKRGIICGVRPLLSSVASVASVARSPPLAPALVDSALRRCVYVYAGRAYGAHGILSARSLLYRAIRAIVRAGSSQLAPVRRGAGRAGGLEQASVSGAPTEAGNKTKCNSNGPFECTNGRQLLRGAGVDYLKP